MVDLNGVDRLIVSNFSPNKCILLRPLGGATNKKKHQHQHQPRQHQVTSSASKLVAGSIYLDNNRGYLAGLQIVRSSSL